MATQCFKVLNEYGKAVQNARVDIIVGRDRIFSNFTSPTGQITATITAGVDNLVYVRFNSYTPVQIVYNGSGSEPCIEINIHTCQPLQQEPLENGRFLVWNPVAYCIRDQTLPLEICGPDRTGQNPVCDRFDIEEPIDYYSLPVVNGDVIRWVMDKSEVDYDGDSISNLRIGITQDGVLIQEDVGTIIEYEDQLFCTATIPCLKDCEYEFVVYRIDVIDYIGVVITPPTLPELCDGQIQAVVTLGSPPYEYSLDGINWQSSDTFTNLCAENYTVYARDQDCSLGTKPAFLDTVDCGMFKGYTLQQVIDLGITLGQLISAGCTLCDFVPENDIQTTLTNKLSNSFFNDTSAWTLIGTGTTIYPEEGFCQIIDSNSDDRIEQTFDSFSGHGIKVRVRIEVIDTAGLTELWGVKIEKGGGGPVLDVPGNQTGTFTFTLNPYSGTGLPVTDKVIVYVEDTTPSFNNIRVYSVEVFEIIDCELI